MKELTQFIRINTIKENEKDKHIITCGRFQVVKKTFDSEDEAAEYVQQHYSKELEEFIVPLICTLIEYKDNYNRELKQKEK